MKRYLILAVVLLLAVPVLAAGEFRVYKQLTPTTVITSLSVTANHTYYVDSSRTDSYTPTGSYVSPYLTIKAALDAMNADVLVHTGAGDGANANYLIKVNGGTYADNLTITGPRSLRIEGAGVTISGTILINSGVGSYDRIEFVGVEGGRAEKGPFLTLSNTITAHRHDDSLIYVGFHGCLISGEFATDTDGTWVVQYENCRVNGAITGTFSAAGHPQILMEAYGFNEFVGTISGKLSFYNVNGADFYSAINTTPYYESRFNHCSFNSSVSIIPAVPSSSTSIYLDPSSRQSLIARTPTTTGATWVDTGKTFGAGLVFDGSTADANETTISVTDPTADRTITIPNASGNVPLLESTQTWTGENSWTHANGLVVGEDKTGGTSNTAGMLKLWSAGDNAFYTTFTTPTQSGTQTYTLPGLQPASQGFLYSSAAGVMGWGLASSDLAASINDETGTGALVLANGPNFVGTITVGDIAADDQITIDPVVKGANQFGGTITSQDLTGARTWTFPDAGGTLALLESANAFTGIDTFGPTLSSSSALEYGARIIPTVNQSGTASYYALDVAPTISAVGSGQSAVIRAKRDGIAAVGKTGLLITNTTAAIDGERIQYAPDLKFVGHAWKTTGSADVTQTWTFRNKPGSSANSTGRFSFMYDTDGTPVEMAAFTVSNAGSYGFYSPDITGNSFSLGNATNNSVTGSWLSHIGTSTQPLGLYNNTIADSGTAIAFISDTTYALSTSGAKLWSWKNGGVEKIYFGYNGAATFSSTVMAPTFEATTRVLTSQIDQRSSNTTVTVGGTMSNTTNPAVIINGSNSIIVPSSTTQIYATGLGGSFRPADAVTQSGTMIGMQVVPEISQNYRAIASFTVGSPTSITTTANHGLTTGDTVRFMSQAGDGDFAATMKNAGVALAITTTGDAKVFTVAVDTTGHTPTTMGGYCVVSSTAGALSTGSYQALTINPTINNAAGSANRLIEAGTTNNAGTYTSRFKVDDEGRMTARNHTIPLTADAAIEVGQIVCTATVDERVIPNPKYAGAANTQALGVMPIGVYVGKVAAAQGDLIDVSVGGITYVVPDSTESATVLRNAIVHQSKTTNAYAEFDTTVTAGEHDAEIGHALTAEAAFTFNADTGVNLTDETVTFGSDPTTWSIGDPLVYWAAGDTPPTGLTTGKVYWIKSIDHTNKRITVALSKTGAVVNLSVVGSGTANYFQRLPKVVLHWN